MLWQLRDDYEKAMKTQTTLSPDRVNPEGPDDSGPEVARIDPGDSIVVNPAGETGQSRQVSNELAEHWRNQLLERAQGVIK